MGTDNPVSVDAEVADSNGARFRAADFEERRKRAYLYIVVLLFAAAVYAGTMISPPSLMDDVDAVQAQIGRTMLVSGDWVTARIDTLTYLEKPPFLYWSIAASYRIFGQHDWAARIPTVLFAIGLAVLTMAFGVWAFGSRAGFYAGLCIATCVGLFLFTRIQIPDVMLTFVIALALWSFLRALDEEELHPRLWAASIGVSLGAGLLMKSLIAVAFPVGTGLIYLAITRQLFVARTWKRLHPFMATLIALAIAGPWYVLATLRNPPYFDFTMHPGPGQYHGFLWFFFINEQLLRFLNLRYPRDYNTVPRLWFWAFHLIWLFPWSVYFPAIAKLSFKPSDRAGRARLLALVWVGFVMVFFTFSTTQEYYSMPIYPALALLLGSAMAARGNWVLWGTRTLVVISAAAAVAVTAIFIQVRGLPTPGDISQALIPHPGHYTLSLGHMQDLTLESFAYLRAPLILAGAAFLVGALGCALLKGERAFWAAAVMMVIFFQAARMAMVTFDPYLASRPLAEALMKAPQGTLIAQGHYYEFSSVFFYANRTGLLSTPPNKRVNLEYGSYAPGAPKMFIDDAEFASLWQSPERAYLVAFDTALPHYEGLAGAGMMHTVAESGGKTLVTNQPLTGAP